VFGILVGIIIYASIHIVPYPDTYFSLTKLLFSTHTPPVLTFDISNIIESAKNTIIFLLLNLPWLLPLIIWRGMRIKNNDIEKNKKILVISAALIISMVLLINNRNYYYLILISPMVDVLLASLLIYIVPIKKTSNNHNLISIILSITLIFFHLLIPMNYLSRQNYQCTLDSVSDKLQAVIINREKIIGPQTYWFKFYDHEYYSWEQLVYYRRYKPGSNLNYAFREIQPDILIIDGHLQRYIYNELTYNAYQDSLHLPEGELKIFLTENSDLISDFQNDCYGNIQVYRFNW